MAGIATETRKVKIGHVVLANSFRNPALTGEIIYSIDNISNRCVLLWIGTVWYEEGYKAYGYPFPSAKQRVGELEEALTIFKRLFTEETTDFEGKFWKLENCRNFPKPIQKPLGALFPDKIMCLKLAHFGFEFCKWRVDGYAFVSSLVYEN